MNQLEGMYPANKQEMYALLQKQLGTLVEGEAYLLPNLCNATALIYSAMSDINWTGFYLMKGDSLLLGPFQGKPACVHIPLGKGVCGMAAAENRPIIVDDVRLFPGHIACDSESRPEIVIPISNQGVVFGVLDIDSPSLSRFDEEDRQGLEKLMGLFLSGQHWNHLCI